MMKCFSCNKRKELTVHGTCWKCHVSSLNFGSVPGGARRTKPIENLSKGRP